MSVTQKSRTRSLPTLKQPTGLSSVQRVTESSLGLWNSVVIKNEYDKFRSTYYNDPVGFARDCILWEAGDGLTKYQQEILGEIMTRKRVSVRGPHGLGKSALAAITILWFALTRDGDDWKIPTTASAWRQLEKFLWPEVHKWSRRVNWTKVGRDQFSGNSELLQLSLRLRTGEAFALASDDHNMIEGAHADHLLYVFDEAKTIPGETWDAAEGAMVSAQAYWLAISTPGDANGRFYDIHSRKTGYRDWWVRHVKVQETVDADRITMKWIEDRRAQWGENSAVYRNRVLGEFASTEEDTVIPLDWIERANDNWGRWRDLTPEGTEGEPEQIGLDVGRFGGDKTVFAFRVGTVITELQKFRMADTMQTAGNAIMYMQRTKNTVMLVDVIGIGAGVYDRLYEQMPERVYPFTAGGSAGDFTDRAGVWRFVDARSAAWWNLRELLDPSNGFDYCLPPDDELTGDLTAPKWQPMSNGRIKVEAKEKIKERLRRSTDCADAVVEACFNPTIGGMEFA